MTTSQTKRPYRHNSLSQAQEDEMLRLYTDTDQPITRIADGFGVSHTTVYHLLDRRGISWRRGSGPSFAAWFRTRAHNAEADQEAEYEAERASEDAKIPPEQIAEWVETLKNGGPTETSPASPFSVGAEIGLAGWTVELRETLSVTADSIEGALFAARQMRPHARVTAIFIAVEGEA